MSGATCGGRLPRMSLRSSGLRIEGDGGVAAAHRSAAPPAFTPVARIEPSGPAFGRPDDKLREIRGNAGRERRFPDFAPLNPGYETTTKPLIGPVIWSRGPVLPKKIFLFSSAANHRLIAPILSRKRGRRPSSRTLGRVAVDAAASSRALCARTSGAEAYGEVVWS